MNLILFAATLLVLALPTSAAPNKGSAVKHLQKFLHDVHSLKADFTQTVTHSTLSGTKKSHGTVLIKRPNRFRWNYVSPEKQVIDADGKHIWIYDAELEQVTVKPLKTAMASSPAMLLSGQGSLEKAFKVADDGKHDGLAWITLKPKKTDAAFTKIRVGLDSKNVRVMELTGANLGQVTRIRFSHLQRNAKISDKIFQFSPPKGVDVIKSSASSDNERPQ
jgi:outer membrane lipoprotein carrier protein